MRIDKFEYPGHNEAVASANAYKVTLFLPLTDNDGNEFEQTVWEWWTDEFTRLLTGFTDLGTVRGWWLGHSDQNRWIIAIVSEEEQIDRIRDFLGTARIVFRQWRMYLEYHPVTYEEV